MTRSSDCPVAQRDREITRLNLLVEELQLRNQQLQYLNKSLSAKAATASASVPDSNPKAGKKEQLNHTFAYIASKQSAMWSSVRAVLAEIAV